jgi:CheY-like chemotaxis protein
MNPETTPSNSAGATPKKGTIFVVDDDKFLLDMYALKFSKSGYVVEAADNGEDALKKFRGGFKPDILLMDVIMPGLTGLETLEAICKESLLPDTTIVMLTNQNMPEDLERAKKCKVDGYIVKAMAIPSEVLSEVEKIHAAKHAIQQNRPGDK